MAKEIIPHKLVIALNEDGTFKDGVLMYKKKVDNVTDERKYYTIGVKAGIDMAKLIDVLISTHTVALTAEDIKETALIDTLTAQKIEVIKDVGEIKPI